MIQNAQQINEHRGKPNTAVHTITHLPLASFWVAVLEPLCRQISAAKLHGRRQNHCTAYKLIFYNAKRQKRKNEKESQNRWEDFFSQITFQMHFQHDAVAS